MLLCIVLIDKPVEKCRMYHACGLQNELLAPDCVSCYRRPDALWYRREAEVG